MEYCERPFIAYVHTHYSGGSNRYETLNEMWTDTLRIMKSPSLVGNFLGDSYAELKGPDIKVRLTPYALFAWL